MTNMFSAKLRGGKSFMAGSFVLFAHSWQLHSYWNPHCIPSLWIILYLVLKSQPKMKSFSLSLGFWKYEERLRICWREGLSAAKVQRRSRLLSLGLAGSETSMPLTLRQTCKRQRMTKKSIAAYLRSSRSKNGFFVSCTSCTSCKEPSGTSKQHQYGFEWFKI